MYVIFVKVAISAEVSILALNCHHNSNMAALRTCHEGTYEQCYDQKMRLVGMRVSDFAVFIQVGLS
jgi:hypothetical protein